LAKITWHPYTGFTCTLIPTPTMVGTLSLHIVTVQWASIPLSRVSVFNDLLVVYRFNFLQQVYSSAIQYRTGIVRVFLSRNVTVCLTWTTTLWAPGRISCLPSSNRQDSSTRHSTVYGLQVLIYSVGFTRKSWWLSRFIGMHWFRYFHD
jgi:hypothetical protein